MSACTNEACSIIDHASNFTNNEAADNFSNLVLQDLHFVKASFEAVQYKASQVIVEVNEAVKVEFERDFKLNQLKKKASKLIFKIPFNLTTPSDQPNPNIKWRRRSHSSDLYQVKESSSSINPNIDCDGFYHNDNRHALNYNELRFVVPGLSVSRLRLLLCFLLFPKKAGIKRSILICWAEVLVINHSTYPIFKAIDELIEKHLIKAIYKRSNLSVSGYWMHPSVHSILKSKWSFWSRRKICLGHSLDVEEDIYYTKKIFKHILPKDIDILYLGKWNKWTEQHIEVINPKLFFKAMSKLTGLIFVSLREISMIEELPKFITELKWLKILDLKACHNLEVIPPSIANLQHSLIHLDMSECYLLAHLPKAFGTLVKLKVLKGFLVGQYEENSCTLEDLVDLQQLEKLSISTSMKGFPNKSQLKTLQKFEKLLSLTISWGGCSSLKARLKEQLTFKEPIVGDHETLSLSIEKLDLLCVPGTVTHWLKATNFENLKKLYIRGGQFFDLGQVPEENQWNVEILRLKHLSKLSIDWSELQLLFPKLIFLEQTSMGFQVMGRSRKHRV